MTGQTIDFTQGNVVKKIALFAIPIVLAEIFQNLYNTVDSMVVGNFVGGEALAAVSVCSAISQLVVGFFNGMSIGASVLAGSTSVEEMTNDSAQRCGIHSRFPQFSERCCH